MFKRRLVRWGLGAALVLLVTALTWLFTSQMPRPGMTEANFRHIRPDMALNEVEALFGKPADDAVGNEDVYWCVWAGPEGRAVVGFDERTTTVPYKKFTRSRASFLDRLRVWLGW